MAGVKGNDGKAASSRIVAQLVAVFGLAIVAVVAVKLVGTGSWHAGATMDDHQIHQEATDAVKAGAPVANERHKRADVQTIDTNLITFVFGNLDGEKGSDEGMYQNFIYFLSR